MAGRDVSCLPNGKDRGPTRSGSERRLIQAAARHRAPAGDPVWGPGPRQRLSHSTVGLPVRAGPGPDARLASQSSEYATVALTGWQPTHDDVTAERLVPT
jgi:hypothetical protein